MVGVFVGLGTTGGGVVGLGIGLGVILLGVGWGLVPARPHRS